MMLFSSKHLYNAAQGQSRVHYNLPEYYFSQAICAIRTRDVRKQHRVHPWNILKTLHNTKALAYYLLCQMTLYVTQSGT